MNSTPKTNEKKHYKVVRRYTTEIVVNVVADDRDNARDEADNIIDSMSDEDYRKAIVSGLEGDGYDVIDIDNHEC